MYPPIFELVANASINELGTDPVRFWPFGLARQEETRPYAVHQLVYGAPENSMSCAPSIDNYGIQVDCYAKSVTEARAIASSIRDALEADAHLTAYNGETWEPGTGLYRVSLTFDFWTGRSS